MQFWVKFEGGLELCYQLEDFPTSRAWAQMISELTPTDRCTNITVMGRSTDQQRHQRGQRLTELAEILNHELDGVHMPQGPITPETLHLMHIHFPDALLSGRYPHLKSVLGEYNDCIHWLESSHSRGVDVKLEFKDRSPRADIDPEDLPRFTANWAWGDLTLHYAHAGKHAAEIMWNRDYDCPPHQFVPQTQHTAACYLRFTPRQTKLERWQSFWSQRGGLDFWGMEHNDPRMALGYIRLGQLINTPRDRDSIEQYVRDHSIENWTIEYD